MNKRYILAIVCLCTSLSIYAQTAKQVLDATAARFNTSGIKATFKATSYEGNVASGDATGTMLMQGHKFQVTSTEMSAWFDGKTQWAMIAGGDEVNVTEPTPEELTATNPALLLQLYKKGYNMSVKSSTLRGKPTYLVTLVAQKPTDSTFSTILLDIEQGTYTPFCIRAKQGNNWIRLVIHSFQTGQTFNDATFKFPSQSYPDVEIIDLR